MSDCLVAQRTRCMNRAQDLKRHRHTERMGHMRDGACVVGRHQHGMSSGGIGERFSQPSGREHVIAQVALIDQQQVDISREREVLKSIVEHVDRHTEIALGALATFKAVRSDENRYRREQPGEQQRFVACGTNVGHDLCAV